MPPQSKFLWLYASILLVVASKSVSDCKRFPLRSRVEFAVDNDNYFANAILLVGEQALPNIAEFMFIPRTQSLRSPCIKSIEYCKMGNPEFDLIYTRSKHKKRIPHTFSSCDHFKNQCTENSLEPSVTPTQEPSSNPSVTPTQSPSVDPSHSPSIPPSQSSLFHIRLKIPPQVIWHSQNIKIFKKEVSKLYDIPEENILLVSMERKAEENILEVGVEIKGFKTPQVNFEDEVYLSERLTKTSLGNAENIVLPLEILVKQEKYETFRSKLCTSLLENQLTIEDIDIDNGQFVIKNIFEDLKFRLDQKQLIQPGSRTLTFTLPLALSELDSGQSILRLKEALSFHLESSPDDLSILSTNSISSNSRQTRVVMKCRSCFQEKLENFELDREEKLDIVDHVLGQNFLEFATKHIIYFVFICWCGVFGLLFSYVRTMAFQAVSGEDNSNAPRARLLEDNIDNFLQPGQPIQNPAAANDNLRLNFERIGEASDYPESEEEISVKEGRSTGVDMILSPVSDCLTDDEKQQKPEEPMTVINPILG